MLVESVLEDGFDVFVRVGLDGQSRHRRPPDVREYTASSSAGLLDRTGTPVPDGDGFPDEAEQFLGLRTDGPSPLDETGRSPFKVLLVRLGHVLG